MIGNAYELSKVYRQELEQAVRQRHLIRTARMGQPTVINTVIVWTGQRLVSAGEFLQAQSHGAQTARGSLM